MALINLKIVGDAKEASKTIDDLEKRLKSLNQIKIHIGLSEKELTALRGLTAEQAKVINANAKLVNANARLREAQDKLAISIEKTKQERAKARAEQAKATQQGLKSEATIRKEIETTNRAIEVTKRQADMTKRAEEATKQKASQEKIATEVTKQKASQEKIAAEATKQAAEKTQQAAEKTKQKASEEVIATQKAKEAAAKLAAEREKNARAARQHAQATEEETKTIGGLFTSLKDAGSKFATTFGSTIRNRISSAITSAVRSATSEAIATMKEVDTQLTNIQKVSNISTAERNRIGASAYATASQYGVSADDYLSSVYTFTKAGLSDSAEEMAKLATKTMLVGDTTATVASKFLIAANAAWKYNGDIAALSKVVDEADWINNNYATDLAKLSQGMPIVAATAANMGMSLEETLAVLGTITSVTQESGTKAATAWRALSMNLAGEIGTFLTEDGDEIEVTAESIKSVTDALVKYAPEAVEAAKATGQMIDPIKAVEALATAYKEKKLTDVELTNILMGVGGKLRTNQLTALVKNFDLYKKMLGELGGAAGTADKEISTMLGSWEKKAQVLKNTWTEFISHLVDSNMFKDLISGITTFVEWMDKGAGSIMAVAAAAGAAALAFGPWGAAIAAVATGLALITGHTRNANEEFKNATESLRNMQDTFEKQNEELEKTKDNIDATALVTKAYIDKLDTLDKNSEEYHDTLVRITELMPELKKYIDLENDTIDGGTELLQKRAEAWVESARMAAYAANMEAKASAVANAEIAKAEAELKQKRAKTELDAYNKRVSSLLESIRFNEEKRASETDPVALEYYAKMADVLDEELSKVLALRNEAQDSFDAQTRAVNDYTEALDAANQELEEFQVLYDEQRQKADDKNKSNVGGFLEEFGKGGNVDLTNRPVIDAKELLAAGWEEAAEGAATLFTTTFSNKAGDLAVNLTPILYDPKTGEHKVLSPEELNKYAEGLLKGKHDDFAKLQIGAEFHGEEAIQQAEAAAQKIHELQEEYFSVDISEVEKSSKDAASAISESNEEIKTSGDSAASATEKTTRRYKPAYDAARHEVKEVQEDMVDDVEDFAADTGSAIESGAQSAASDAASAGASIGLAFAQNIAQSDAVKDSIAAMVGAAKEFMRSLGGNFSIHPSGADYYYERGTGNKVYYKAAGTTNAEGGPTLVNELGPELINDHGKVYIANGGKPGVVNLNRGAIVLTAEQTAGALKGTGTVPRRGAASGTNTAWMDWMHKAPEKQTSWIDSVYSILKIDKKDKPNKGGKGGRGGGGSGGGSDSATSAAALKKAQEELDKELSNLEKQIKLAINQGDYDKASSLYNQGQAAIDKMVGKYRSAGYKDTSNEILDLLNKKYDYDDKKEDLKEKQFKEIVSQYTDIQKEMASQAERYAEKGDFSSAAKYYDKSRKAIDDLIKKYEEAGYGKDSKEILDLLDKKLDTYEDQFNTIKKAMVTQAERAADKGDIAKAEEYYGKAQEAVNDLIDQYRKAGYAEDSKEILDLLEESENYDKKILDLYKNEYNGRIKNLELQIKKAQSEGDYKKVEQLYEQMQETLALLADEYRKAGYAENSDEILDLLNKNNDYADAQLQLYQTKWDELVDSLDAQDQAQKLAEQLQQKQEAIEKAKESLANAQKQRTVRIYNAETGQWEWISDQSKVSTAQQNLENAEKTYADEVKSQALAELKAMGDTIADLNEVVLGPALSAVVTMAEDSKEFQAFAEALNAVYGIGTYLSSTIGSTSVLGGGSDSHDTVYSFGDLVLTEEQASTMTLAQLAQKLQVLKLTS